MTRTLSSRIVTRLKPLFGLLLMTPLVVAPIALFAQGRGVSPKDLYKPLTDSWPTYSGDYSGRRFSPLKQINQSTVKSLTLAWVGPPDGRNAGRRLRWRTRRWWRWRTIEHWRRGHRKLPGGRLADDQGHTADG